MALTANAIISCLAAGDFDRLIGEFECDWLECKRQPYDLTLDQQKLELAKDVSGLANAGGGLLLIGFSTTRSPAHGEDQIDKARPFPSGRFDSVQYRQVIADWTWPPLEKIVVSPYTYPLDETKAVAVIEVPAALGEESPVLVAKSLLDNNRKSEIFFGYCVRRQAHVTHYGVERIQALLRDGRRLDAEVREGFQSLQASIEELRNLRTAPAEQAVENVDERINAALHVAGLDKEPALVLAATPPRKINLRSLFESRRSPSAVLIEEPPCLRKSGFNLDVDENSRIVEGRLRRAVSDGSKLLEAHRDGLALFAASGNQEFLCWGRENRQRNIYLINQIALVESVYLFTLLTYRLYSDQVDANDEVGLEMRILRTNQEKIPFVLEAGRLDRWTSVVGTKSAPDGNMSVSTKFLFGTDSPERAAVLLLSEVYSWFGFEEDKIPYTKVTPAGRVVDTDVLKNLS